MPDHPIEPVDLLVVGGGTAGLVGAHTAAALGVRTVLVEHGRTGGDCLWTGCVPSKALLAAASAAASARRAAGLGVDVGEVRVDFTRVRAHVQAAIAAVQPKDSPRRSRRPASRW
ncbi:FAD-dependent oxidoreductase [Blastococcus brunescens]|uniref:FAD-dependent oxidoreductase n=1 Tax=Blastococcus brunescens TaxID=1564165 RepID=A0ABZ1AZE6_9ACTN|nr:FAD-dependent oxidoreductase [Blastococcus sp. BMG 8361]WRL63497.1 FAD-dependent oxidoreductase [Blastococcus sp. BMG 8361]